jgi:outer membrane protein assembly factor BamD
MQKQTYKNSARLLCLLAVLFTLLLAGCSKGKLFSSFGFKPGSPDSVEELAVQGLDHFNRGKYYKAQKTFETILNQYPFSEYSLLAELKTADCSFYQENYEEALLQYKTFEERHPTNEAIPYVMLQTAMSHYNQIDTVDRDTSHAADAIYAFSRLLRAFPDSPYTEEAQTRIKASRNYLATHEYYVAGFYVRTYAYEEAKARLEFLLQQYPDSNIALKAEALLRALQNDTPPRRTMFGWLPKSFPDWEAFIPDE